MSYPNPIARRVLLAAAGGVLLTTVAAVTGCDESPGPRHPAAGNAPARTSAPTRTSVLPSASRARPPVRAAESRWESARHGKARPGRFQVPYGEPMFHVDGGPKVIALTIDDGPSRVYTPQVLQILRKYGVTASFSMVGENAAALPAIARDVAAAGHMIVNHTWNHADLRSLTTAGVREEISRAADAIHTATGVRPVMFRAPYGFWSRTVFQCCAEAKLTPLDWSVDPSDWARPGSSAIVKTILSTTRTGSIILEHDGGGDRSQTVAALRIWLPRLLDAGYQFTTP